MMGTHRESQTEEWKKEWRDEHLHAVCAFANGTTGGKIIIGKDDKGVVFGVDEKEKKKHLASLPTQINNTMRFYPDVKTVTLEGKTCVEITIEPQNFPVSYNGKYYKRSGSNSVVITGSELDEFLLKKKGLTWGGLISDKVKLEDISKEAVSAFVKRGQEVKRISSAVDPDDTEGILRRYELMNENGITNAAAVLFSERPTRTSFAAVTKIGLFPKKGGRLMMEDIIDCPVIFQPERTLEKLLDRYVQPRFYLDGIVRKEKYRYPVNALREAILNAVQHRQYMSGQETTIAVFPDCIEISNPGKPPEGWTMDQLSEAHRSEPPNQLIAKVFHDMGVAERWGVGLSLIREECEKAGIPQPKYDF
ncbi:MAG: putative DNA binding domain-containing protein, partial [Methanomassiliicoccaceae archaeon]|nr:putative DNA binding domain-containing protein [Methanomassiliicoccaceae archaeon]